MLDLDNIDLILWDLDGVLYVKDMGEFNIEPLNIIFGKAINNLDSNISATEGLNIIKKYYFENPVKFYSNIQRDYGIDKYKLDFEFHKLLVDELYYKSNDYIEKEYSDILKSFDARQIVVTQSNKVWTDEVLKEANLVDFFDEIISSKVTLEKPKIDDNSLYLDICNEMNVSPEKAVMIEDSCKNLKAAKKHGLKTVLFNYGRDSREDYVDYQYRDIRDFLSKI
jgi:HAD superfamily hydrolase (TIGR01509 family)